MPVRSSLRTPHVISPAGFGLGYRPTSQRNWHFMANLPRLDGLLHRLGIGTPSVNDNKTGLVNAFGQPFDQNQTGSCTAQSTCKGSRITLTTRGLMPTGVDDFSPWLQYGVTRQIENAAGTPEGSPLPNLDDVGAEPADCITAVQTVGLAKMGTLVGGFYDDVDPSNVNVQPVLSDVEPTRIESGAHLVDIHASDLASQWMAQVNAGIGGCIALFVDTAGFMSYSGRTPITKINLNDSQGGGHQITGPLYWYTSSALGLVWGFGNSWGSWGLNGLGEITHSCLMTAIDAALAFDCSLLPEGT